MAKKRRPTVDRFWEKVEKTEGCWNWTGAVYGGGYGNLNAGPDGGYVRAHRFSYELHHGPIPHGQLVMHACDNRRCVNPAHLSLGTHRDNTRDAMAKGRLRVGEFQRAKTHCVRGHAFTPENTITAHRPGRSPERGCRECRRMRKRAARALAS